MLYDFRFAIIPGEYADAFRETVTSLRLAAETLGWYDAADAAADLLAAAPLAMVEDWDPVVRTSGGRAQHALWCVETNPIATEALAVMLTELSAAGPSDAPRRTLADWLPLDNDHPQAFVDHASALLDVLAAGPGPDDWTLLHCADAIAAAGRTTALGTPATWQPDEPFVLAPHQDPAAARQIERFAALFGHRPGPVTELTGGPWQLRDAQARPVRLLDREEHWQRRLENEPALTGGHFTAWPERLRQHLAAAAVSWETNVVNAALFEQRPPTGLVPDTDRWDPASAAVIGPPRADELPWFDYTVIGYAETDTAAVIPQLQQAAIDRYVHATADRARAAGWTIRTAIGPPDYDDAGRPRWVSADPDTATATVRLAEPDEPPPGPEHIAATLHQLTAVADQRPAAPVVFAPPAPRALGAASGRAAVPRRRP